MQLRILTAADIRSCLDMPGAIQAMRVAFTQLSSGDAVVPDRLGVETEKGVSLFMPGYLPDGRHLAAKIVSVFPGNRERGLPAINAVVLVLDSETGLPRALMDGTYLTALRTGAASGLATEVLALDDASVLAVFGAGPQARTQIDAVRAVRPISEVRVFSLSAAESEALAQEVESVPVTVVDDPARALAGAQVIVTATDSRRPVFPGDLVEPGAHINSVGAFTPEMRELDGALVSRATVIVDSRDTVMAEAGDLVQAIREGMFSLDRIHAELGEVVSGARPGRTSSEAVTLFKSVGSAAQDVAAAGRILEAAEASGLGVSVEI
jgi:ornithine cyclodeaminase/alanine dehydrogenase-like protein (mu-crystallin family)